MSMSMSGAVVMAASSGHQSSIQRNAFIKMTTLTTIPDLYIDKVEDTRYSYISPLNYF